MFPESIVDLPTHVDEPALLRDHLSPESLLLARVEPEHRGQHREGRRRVVDEFRIDADGAGGDGHGELLAVAVEDGAPIGGDGGGPGPLVGGSRSKRRSPGGLEFDDLEDDDDQERADTEGDEPHATTGVPAGERGGRPRGAHVAAARTRLGWTTGAVARRNGHAGPALGPAPRGDRRSAAPHRRRRRCAAAHLCIPPTRFTSRNWSSGPRLSGA